MLSRKSVFVPQMGRNIWVYSSQSPTQPLAVTFLNAISLTGSFPQTSDLHCRENGRQQWMTGVRPSLSFTRLEFLPYLGKADCGTSIQFALARSQEPLPLCVRLLSLHRTPRKNVILNCEATANHLLCMYSRHQHLGRPDNFCHGHCSQRRC